MDVRIDFGIRPDNINQTFLKIDGVRLAYEDVIFNLIIIQKQKYFTVCVCIRESAIYS